MNVYGNLTRLKSLLGITGTDDDADLLVLLVGASRMIDRYCERFFYAKTATWYYEGAGRKLNLDDLLSITTLKVDTTDNGTYDTTYAATDYYLYPFNEWPKWKAEIRDVGNYGDFGSGTQKAVEIAGLWGYGTGKTATPYTVTVITVTVADATTTTVTVSEEDVILPGHTILAGTEQMYVSAATSDDSDEITVVRGVNGTTAAAQSAATASIYDYPEDIIQVCYDIASRLHGDRGKQGFTSERLGDYAYSRSPASIVNDEGLTQTETGTLKHFRNTTGWV